MKRLHNALVILLFTYCHMASSADAATGILVHVDGGLGAMPVTMGDDVPAKALRLVSGLGCSVAGIHLTAQGVQAHIMRKRKQERLNPDLEQGKQPLLTEDDEDRPRRCCRCSQGMQLMGAGLTFFAGGILVTMSSILALK